MRETMLYISGLHMTITRYRPKKQGKRGVALVELALVLPLLVIIMLGCIDFGRFAYSYIALTNAVKEGAYHAATHPFTPESREAWEADIRNVIQNELSHLHDFETHRDMINIHQPQWAPEPGGFYYTEVTAEYPFEMIVEWSIIRSWIGGSNESNSRRIMMASTCRMRSIR